MAGLPSQVSQGPGHGSEEPPLRKDLSVGREGCPEPSIALSLTHHHLEPQGLCQLEEQLGPDDDLPSFKAKMPLFFLKKSFKKVACGLSAERGEMTIYK